MSRYGSKVLLLGTVSVLLLSGCLFVATADVRSVEPPDPSATGFRASLEDEDRLVAAATVGGGPVVYVYDLVADTWTHAATITPDAASFPSSAWGASVSVSDDTIVLTDSQSTNGAGPGYGGAVHVYELVGGTWTRTQTIVNPAPLASVFATGAWVSGDGLLLATGATCLEECTPGAYSFYERSGGAFVQATTPRPYQRLSVDADDGTFVVGSAWETFDLGNVAPSVQVVDTSTSAPTVLFEETGVAGHAGAYSRVGIAGDTFAYVSCCSGTDQLFVRQIDGTATTPAASFPLDPEDEDRPISGLAVLPDMILVNEPMATAPWTPDGWRSYVFVDGTWQRGTRVKTFDGEQYVDLLTPTMTTAGEWVAVQRADRVDLVSFSLVDARAED